MCSTVMMYSKILSVDLEPGVLRFSSKSNMTCDIVVFGIRVISITCRWDGRLICGVGGHLTEVVVVVALIMTVMGQRMVRSFRRSGW
jgi:hypothetical protein